MPRSVISGSRGKSMFSFVRNCQTFIQSGRTVSYSHQQRMRVPVAPHPCRHLVLSTLRILAILKGIQWYMPPSLFLRVLLLQARPIARPIGSFIYLPRLYTSPRAAGPGILAPGLKQAAALATRGELRLLFHKRGI